MSDSSTSKALLPSGLRDVLPPAGAFEARTVEAIVSRFAAHGYDRVKPPLIEFEESLLLGSGTAAAPHTFRLMDPVSQRMMGLRPDMTLQIARIATTRLRKAPRPLRLSYAGQVLRVKGTQLRPERQFGQVGAELIGSPSAKADAEVILLAVEALQALGVEGLSVDLGLPTLVPAVCADLAGLDEAALARLRTALDHKDAAEVAAFGGATADVFGALLGAAGPATRALEALAAIDLSPTASAERAKLMEVADLVRARAPGLTITVDPVENRGYEYHTGVTFTFFALDVRGELGRGGRYEAGGNGSATEPAVGVTLFTDSLLRALPRPKPAARVYVPDHAVADGPRLRADGWITVEGLDAAADPRAEAARLGCSHYLADGEVRPTKS